MKISAPILVFLVVCQVAVSSPFEGKLSCSSLPAMMQIYLQNHYAVHELTEEVRKRTMDQFVRSLDPSRTTLFKEDELKIRSFLPELLSFDKPPICKKLSMVKDIMVGRSREAMEYASRTLRPDFKVDETIVINTDPDQREYAENREQREEILRQMIHFQYANYIATDMEPKKARTQLYHRFELALKRAQETTDLDLLNQFMGSFAIALDPHSSFMSAERLEDFRISMELKLEGIGAQLTWKDGYTIIDEIVPGGAADRQGQLRPKDKILAVAQGDEDFSQVIDMDLTDVVRLIRGAKGTVVRLSILRQGTGTERFEVAIERDVIDIKDSAASLSWQTSSDGQKIAVIDLPGFYGDASGSRSASRDVGAKIIEARKGGAQGLILNLSRNGGGLLEEAVKVAGLFLGEGAIVATQNTIGQTRVLKDEDERMQWDGPLVVLISRRSASASEIVAGAIRDYRRGIVVGDTHTFGKGTVQMFTPISEEFGGVTITTGMFFRPSGLSTQKDGVEADIVLPSIWDREDFGEKALDYVLPGQRIPQFRDFSANPPNHRVAHWVSSQAMRYLRERSQERVKNHEEFQKIAADVKEGEENRYLLKVKDLLDVTDDEKKEQKEAEEKSRSQLIAESDAPYLQECVAILKDFFKLIES